MKENFPNLAKEIDFQEVQEAQRVPKKLKIYLKIKEGILPHSGKGNRLSGIPGSPESPKEVRRKEEHTKAHHHYITQDETEGENLRSSKRQEHSSLQRTSHKTVS